MYLHSVIASLCSSLRESLPVPCGIQIAYPCTRNSQEMTHTCTGRDVNGKSRCWAFGKESVVVVMMYPQPMACLGVL